MTLDVRNVNLDAFDLEEAERFWTQALGYKRAMGEDGVWCALVDPSGDGLPVGLQRRDERKQEGEVNRVHMDLMTDDVEAEVDRLLSLGATRVEGWPYPVEATFVVLRDPSGNEFCVTEIVEM